MFDQVRAAGKTFAAFGAAEWFLPCVDSLVGHKIRVCGEELSAGGAGEWLLPDLDPLVLVTSETSLTIGEAVHQFGVFEELAVRRGGHSGGFFFCSCIRDGHVLLTGSLADGGILSRSVGVRVCQISLVTGFVLLLLNVSDYIIDMGVVRRGEDSLLVRYQLFLDASGYVLCLLSREAPDLIPRQLLLSGNGLDLFV